MSAAGREAAKVAVWIAGGAVVGAGLGLLLAPQTGAETRRDVTRYAKRAQIQAARFGRAVKSGVNEAVERGKLVMQKHSDSPGAQAA